MNILPNLIRHRSLDMSVESRQMLKEAADDFMASAKRGIDVVESVILPELDKRAKSNGFHPEAGPAPRPDQGEKP
jgi:hypothetical protein